MPARNHTPNGAPIWADLLSSDIERTRAFYSQLFGWDASEPNEDSAATSASRTAAGLRMGGAMAARTRNPTPDTWSVYLSTDDAQKTLESAVAHGGQVYVEPMTVGDMGTMAVLADASGAAVGVWQPNTHTGFGAAGRSVRTELVRTATPATTTQLLRSIATSSTGTPTSRAIRPTCGTPSSRTATQQLAGIMDATQYLPEGVPAHWVIFFGVDDTDATLARVVELGGSIMMPPKTRPMGASLR